MRRAESRLPRVRALEQVPLVHHPWRLALPEQAHHPLVRAHCSARARAFLEPQARRREREPLSPEHQEWAESPQARASPMASALRQAASAHFAAAHSPRPLRQNFASREMSASASAQRKGRPASV